MKPSTMVWRLTLGVGLVLPLLAFSGEPSAVTPRRHNGIAYVSGGVGHDEQQEMLSLRKDYNLQLCFANRKTGEYRADILVTVKDANGVEVLSAMSDGPLFYARLPAGGYHVAALSDGMAQVRSVTLNKAGFRDLYFYWDSEE